METLPGAPSPCPLAGRCGGCQLPNMEYSRQLRWKQGKVDKLLSPFCRPLPILGMEHPYHYRNKVQAAFGLNRNRRVISGVYQSSSGQDCRHRPVPAGRPEGGPDYGLHSEADGAAAHPPLRPRTAGASCAMC